MKKEHIVILSCGGTIEKSYSERDGKLSNQRSYIHSEILQYLRLPYSQIDVKFVMAIDSLEITDIHRNKLLEFLRLEQSHHGPILVIHGTDTMTESAKYIHGHLPRPNAPVIFTGAMRPLAMKNTDAHQNIIEALMASRLLPPGVYLSFHGKIFSPDNVRKNHRSGTFEEVRPS